MPKTKNPIIRYLALDKCFRDTRKRYYMRDLVKACQDALYEHNGSSVEERTVRQDIKDMMREIPYAAPIEKHMDGHEAWYRYSDCDYSIRKRTFCKIVVEAFHILLQHRVSWKVLVAEIRTWMISFIKMHSFMQSSCWEKLIIFPQQEMTRRLFVLLR